MIDLKELIKNCVQFGHQTWRWNPKMAPYIWGQKDGVHLIDVSITAHQMQKSAAFLEKLAAEGKTILWCGTKKPARGAIAKIAQETPCPTVSHRWIGGSLTNYMQVRKAVAKLAALEELVSKVGTQSVYHTKKELSVFQKEIERLEKNVGGLRSFSWPLGALVVVDVKKEHVAISEAQSAGIPVVALVDTNGDPSDIDYVIPTNDDAAPAIDYIINYLKEAVIRGQKAAAVAPVQPAAVEMLKESVNVEEVLQRALGSDEEEAGRPAGTAARPSRRPARNQGGTKK